MTRFRAGSRGVSIALVVVVLSAIGCAASDALSGAWIADMTLATVQTNPVTAFHSRLDVGFDWGPVSLGTRTDFTADGWLWGSFQFGAQAAFFSMQADLLYSPDPWTFAYSAGFAKIDFDYFWTAYHLGFLGSVFEDEVLRGSVLEVGTSVAGLTIIGYGYMGATLDGVLFSPGPAYVFCNAGDCIAPSVEERYYPIAPTQTSSLVFTGAKIVAETYLCYDVSLEATTTFSADGFESQDFHATVWSIGMVPINLDVLLRFTSQSKSLVVEPRMGVGNRTCYGQVLVDFLTNGSGLVTGFSVYGLDLHMESPSLAFRSLSLFDTDNFSIYYRGGTLSLADALWVGDAGSVGLCGSAGQELTEYWEVAGMAVYRGDECCRQFAFMTLNFFGDTDAVFDWMRSEFHAELRVMEGLAMRSAVALDTDGISEWTIGMSVTW